MSKQLILVLGGARSGKSAFAERLALRLGKSVAYAATATADDEEMRLRIAAHRAARPATWLTIEEPLNLPGAIAQATEKVEVVVVDCLTLWLSNLILHREDGEGKDATERALLAEVARLLEVYRAGQASLIVIANEVGLGLVPPNPLGRAYRDVHGRANQRVAAAADAFYLLVAGIPLELKQLAAKGLQFWTDETSV